MTAQLQPTDSTPRRWWQEPEFLLMLVLVSVGHIARTGLLPIRGEESRRGQVVKEMEATQDWLTPRQQGQIYLSRPPLHNWLIGASCAAFGNHGPIALRFPSVLAIILTSILLYGYARQFLMRGAALAAALAFATMGETLLISQTAETEAVFILFVSASLMFWHWGLVRAWSPALAWSLSYAMVALACLCKGGLQPIAYFGGAVGAFCLFTGRLCLLFRPAHFVGILAGLAVVSAWVIPYWLEHGWENTISIWMGNTASRLHGWRWQQVAAHLVVFPLEIASNTLPWSLLLLAYLHRDFRAWLRGAHPHALFPALAFLVAFPTIWLPPEGLSRYLSPLYPMLAMLIGFVVEAAANESGPALLRLGWVRFLSFTGALLVLGGVGILGAALWPSLREGNFWKSTVGAGLLYCLVLAALGLVLVALRRRQGRLAWTAALGTVALAAVISVKGFLNDARSRVNEDISTSMAQLREQLPADAPLVSFGKAHHLFVYHYDRFVQVQPWPTAADDVPTGGFFCYYVCPEAMPPALPFPWRKVAVISLERKRQASPAQYMVVGERIATW